MDSPKDTIKEKLELVEFLRGYLELKPAGKNFKAKCPFHSDATPSLMISSERQSWRCFGCDQGGDIFTFVMMYERMEFFEALNFLAEKAGVEIKRMAPSEQRQFGVLFEINEQAALFFSSLLKPGTEGFEYLRERGVKEETMREFGLGLAPGGWDNLILYLINRGFETADIERAGLAIRSEGRGTYFDRFRGRLMFPIYNHSGKAVGFTGRVLPSLTDKDTMGKYVNSPETSIFVKSKILYGFSKTKADIREVKKVILMEGQMDVIMAWQDGVLNVAATSGTAFTEEHMKALGRFAEEAVVLFDNDKAGRAAGERALDLLAKNDLAGMAVILPTAKDPADLVKENPGKLKEMVEKPMSAIDFYMTVNLTEEMAGKELKKGVREVLKKILILPSAIDREFWMKKLSKRTGLSYDSLMKELADLSLMDKFLERAEKKEEMGSGGVVVDGAGGLRREGSGGFSRLEMVSSRFLAAAAQRERMDLIKEMSDYFPSRLEKVKRAVMAGEKKSGDEALDKALEYVYMSRSEEEEDLEELKRQFLLECLKNKKQDLAEKIRMIEINKGHESEEFKKVMDEFQKVSLELNREMEEVGKNNK